MRKKINLSYKTVIIKYNKNKTENIFYQEIIFLFSLILIRSCYDETFKLIKMSMNYIGLTQRAHLQL